MTRINTRLPVTFVMRSAIASVILSALFFYALLDRPSFLIDNYQSMIIVVSLLVAVSLFDLYLNNGYAIWYDDRSIHWRKVGLSRAESAIVTMSFDQIVDVHII